MPLPESFKYDVRVRERLTRRGELDESELEKHIAALPDVASNALDVELKQPALQTEAERAENSVIVRPATARPIMMAPTPIEDEEDEDEEDVKPVRAIGSARKADAAADEDEEDEDDDDEDDDDDDDDEEKSEKGDVEKDGAEKDGVEKDGVEKDGAESGDDTGKSKGETSDEGWEDP